MGDWTFLTNHGQVLICVARQPDITLRSIAECAGITERAAHRIVCDLVDGGYLTRTRVGRRNVYEVHPDAAMRHPVAGEHQVGDLLEVLVDDVDDPAGRAGERSKSAYRPNRTERMQERT